VIWLETAPGFDKKSNVHSVVKSLLPSLNERNPDWQVNDDQGMWWDIQLKRPLTSLLNEENQANEFEGFFATAIEDLQVVGVVEKLQEQLFQ